MRTLVPAIGTVLLPVCTGVSLSLHREAVGRQPEELDQHDEKMSVYCVVQPGWLDVSCDGDASVLDSVPEDTVLNAMTGQARPVAEVFKKFKPYRGPLRIQEDLLVDFMGFTVPIPVYCNDAYVHQQDAHAIRARQCSIFAKLKEMSKTVNIKEVQLHWPVIAEEYMEYGDILEAVQAYTDEVSNEEDVSARRKFTMLELGAGYGHWTFTAHRALMQKMPEAEFKLVMVEAMGEMAGPVENLARLNGVPVQNGTDAPMIFHNGYLGSSNGRNAQRNTEIYTKEWGVKRDKHVKAAQTVSMEELLSTYKVPCKIDLVDIDIQGAEYPRMVNQDFSNNAAPGLFHGDAVADLLTKRVKRVHIGTHGGNDEVLADKFRMRGWVEHEYIRKNDPNTFFVRHDTGPVKFGDGVTSFVNPHVIKC